jgi:hypothetical protein
MRMGAKVSVGTLHVAYADDDEFGFGVNGKICGIAMMSLSTL